MFGRSNALSIDELYLKNFIDSEIKENIKIESKFIDNKLIIDLMFNNESISTSILDINNILGIASIEDKNSNEEFYEDEVEEFNIHSIDDADNINIGDYIILECEHNGDICHIKIENIYVKYDEVTGKQYRVFEDENEDLWSSDNGSCINNRYTFYELIGFASKK